MFTNTALAVKHLEKFVRAFKEGEMENSKIKRVRKYGEGRVTLCEETRNRCFGRTVYEDLQTGDLAVIISLVSGNFLVNIDTFLNAHRFFEDMEVLG